MSKKWEEIEYSDIKVGDTIRHTVVFNDELATVQQGVVSGHDANDDSYSLGGTSVWIYPNDVYFNEDEVEAVFVYRKKVQPKPFVFPAGYGAVLKGRNGSGSKLERTLVKVGGDRYYVVETGAIASEHEINLFYVDLVVVSEGTVL